MEYDIAPDPDGRAADARQHRHDQETMYAVVDDFIETWRSESSVATMLQTPDSETRNAIYADAVERVQEHGITAGADDWDELLAPYDHESDALDVAGYLVTAVARETDGITEFRYDGDTPIGGLGYGMEHDDAMLIDCVAHRPGAEADGVLINDGEVDGIGGDRLLYINRGETAELSHMGLYNVINTCEIPEETWLSGASTMVNYGIVQRLKPHVMLGIEDNEQLERPDMLINAGRLREDSSIEDYTVPIDGLEADLSVLQEGVTADDPGTVIEAVAEWNQTHPELSVYNRQLWDQPGRTGGDR